MSLSSLVDALATRIGQEIKAVRAEATAALALKAPLASPVLTGTPTVPNLNSVTTSAALTNQVLVPVAAAVSQDPFVPLWHDSLAFSKLWGAPTYTISTDGATSFGAGTLDPKLFANKEAHTSVTVASTTTRGARWTWNSANIAFNNGVWLVLGHAYGGAAAPTKTVTVESSTDGSAWTVRHTSTYANTEVPVWHYITGWGGAQWLRVTIVWTAGDLVKLTSMRLLTARWGDQGGGPEYGLPITWSADGTMVGIGKGITAPTSALDVTGNGVISGTLSVAGVAFTAKAADSAVVHLTGAETVAGIKTFSDAPVVPTPGVAGNPVRHDDTRNSNARTPTAHVHGAADVSSGTLDIARIPTGSTGTTVPFGNDSRLSDARTPTAHKTSHATGGGDVLTPADIGAQASSSKLTDIAALTATSGNVVTGNGTTWVSSAPANPAFSTKVETIADSASLTGNSASGATQVGVTAALTQAAAVNPPSNGTVGAPYRYVITASGGTRIVTPTGFVANTDDGDGVAISVATGKTVSIFAEYIGAAGWLYGGYKLQA